MNKLFLIFSLPLITFIVILLLSFSKQNQVLEKLEKLNNFSKSYAESVSDLKIEKLFANELTLVKKDLEDFSQLANSQNKFWDELISAELNIVLNHSSQTSSSVNTEITKLLSYLNRTFENRKIKLGSNKFNNVNLFATEDPKVSRYGFGFTAYDGFWPSFGKEESNSLLKQAKIIKEMCEFLLDSYEVPQSFDLISIKRETAGEEDSKHIGDNLFIKTSDVKLLRDSGLIDSYVFEVVFTGKTQNCRSFINQLRPPYSLRSLKVERPSTLDIQSQTSLFDESSNSSQTDILPIIRDITSTFTIITEYIYSGPSDLITQIQEDLSKGLEQEEVEEILTKFR